MNEELNQLKEEIKILKKRIIRLEQKERNRKIFLIIKIILLIITIILFIYLLSIFKTNIDDILGMIEGWNYEKKNYKCDSSISNFSTNLY